MPSKVEIIPIHCKARFEEFDLASVVASEISRNRQRLKDRDVLVISSKFAAVAEGRFVELKGVKPGPGARRLSRSYGIDPQISELILEESDSILGGIRGFVLAFAKGVLAPNAGIDRSNARPGYAILYPSNFDLTARNLRSRLLSSRSRSPSTHNSGGRGTSKLRNLGVVLCDSRISPARLGTTGVAISVAGFEPVRDLRGTTDLFGNKLKVTMRALADQIASAAEIVMGESTESVPVVIVRGADVSFLDRDDDRKMSIEPENCLIIQGLKNHFTGRYSLV